MTSLENPQILALHRPPATARLQRRLGSVVQHPELRAFTLFVLILAVLLLAWDLAVRFHLVLVLAPSPQRVWHRAVTILSDPFFSRGVNDMGIGWHLLASIRRVATGFLLAAAVAIPLGFVVGRSATVAKATDPLSRSSSRVATGLAADRPRAAGQGGSDGGLRHLHVGALAAAAQHHRRGPVGAAADFDLARTLEARRATVICRIVLPAALPNIITGCVCRSASPGW